MYHEEQIIDMKLCWRGSPEVGSPLAGSEDYYIRRDEFLIYIETQANTVRLEAGLPEIGESEAKACFRIIEDFRERWNNPPNNPA